MKTSYASYMAESRCFSICEPDDLAFREDRLMKPVVAHDGFKPARYFLYLFPQEPEFGPEVGEPVYLTQYLRAGNVKEARQKAAVKGERV